MNPLYIAFLLLLAAIAILFLELFIPSAGVLFILGISCVIGSLFFAFQHTMLTGVIFIFIVIILAAILPGFAIEIWKRTWIGKRMMLPLPQRHHEAEPPAPSEPPRSQDGMPIPPPTANERPPLASLVQKLGTTVTTLRPVGTIEVDGLRYDAKSESMMIAANTKVRILSVMGNQLVVRVSQSGLPVSPRNAPPKIEAPSAEPTPETVSPAPLPTEVKPVLPTPIVVPPEVSPAPVPTNESSTTQEMLEDDSGGTIDLQSGDIDDVLKVKRPSNQNKSVSTEVKKSTGELLDDEKIRQLNERLENLDLDGGR